MKHLFSGVAGVAIAASLAATAPAEAQVRSPVPSGMQARSSFNPPAGATVYRENQDGSSTQVSREEFLRGSQQEQPSYQQPRQDNYQYQGYEQQRSEAYEQGRQDTQIERYDERARTYGEQNAVCDGAASNGSAYNRGQRWVDSAVGSDGRRILRGFGASADNRISNQRSDCLAAQTARPDYNQGVIDENRARQTRERLQRGIINAMPWRN